MANALDHVAYLSQEIGPHPAGTEEEQQAALYIADTINQNTSMTAVIEDFNGSAGPAKAKLICSIVIVLCGVLSLIVQLLTVPCLILAIIAAVLYVLEWLKRPFLSRFAKKNISQNVVAKYEPSFSGDAAARRRKVIVVAHYDSGKVRSELKGALLSKMSLLNKIILGGAIAVPVLLFIRFLFFRYASGAPRIIMIVLVVLAVLCVLVGIVLLVSRDVANFNEGANSNASGVAVLLEVAARVGQKGFGGSYETLARAQGGKAGQQDGFAPVVHGEEAARQAGLVPDDADLVYAAGAAGVAGAAAGAAVAAAGAAQGAGVDASIVSDDQARLQAAKAAIAALTGKPVSTEPEPSPFAATDAQAPAAQEETPQADPIVAAAVEASAPSEAPSEKADDGVPAWFTAAKKKARKSADEGEVVVERSVFADALDSAVASAAPAQSDAEDQGGSAVPSDAQASSNEPVQDESPMAAQLRQVREGIQSVQAPRFDHADTPEAPVAAAQVPQASTAASVAIPPIPGVTAPPLDMGALNAQPAPGAQAVPGVQVAAPAVAVPAVAAPAVAVPEVIVPATAAPAVVAPVALQPEAPEPTPQDHAVAAEPEEAAKFVLPAESLIASPESFEAASTQQGGSQSTTVMQTPIAPLDGMSKQYAPLADAAEGVSVAAAISPLNRLSNMAPIGATGAIPSLNARGASNVPTRSSSNAADAVSSRESLIAALPSASGILTPKGSVVEVPSLVPQPDILPSPSGTAAFAPVSVELAQQAESREDLFVDDAEDDAYEQDFTAAGAPAGPGYVDMPKKRGLFGRFRKNKKRDEAYSAQEWLDVDEDFNAQDVGRERGGWESFRDQEGPNGAPQQQEYVDDWDYEGAYGQDAVAQRPPAQGYEAGYEPEVQERTQYLDMNAAGGAAPAGAANGQFSAQGQPFAPAPYPAEQAPEGEFPSPQQWGSGWDKNWNGGAFSNLRKKEGRKKGGRRKGDFDDQLEGHAGEIDFDDARYAAELDAQYQEYGAASDQYGFTPQTEAGDLFAGDPSSEEQRADLRSIMEFRDVNVNTEVWFVALGSQLDSNAGIQAFLNEHKQDLRGALIVELDSLGAGELCFIEKEGLEREVANSSRMKRYVKKTSQETGIRIGNANLLFADSASSYASSQGYQTLHLAGIKDGKQAHFAQADDVIENVSEEILFENTAFVVSLLENI